VATNDVFQFLIHGLCQNQEIVNTVIVKFLTGTGTPAGWITAFEAVLKGVFLPIICNDYDIEHYHMQKITPSSLIGDPRGPLLEFSPTGATAGSAAAGGNLAGQGLIKLSPDVAGRGRRGRMNIGPLGGTAQVEGKLSNTAFTNLKTLAAAIFDNFTPDGATPSADYEIQVWSRKHGVTSPLIAVTAEALIASQRRRALRDVKTRRP